jgi:hypothetical protein
VQVTPKIFIRTIVRIILNGNAKFCEIDMGNKVKSLEKPLNTGLVGDR